MSASVSVPEAHRVTDCVSMTPFDHIFLLSTDVCRQTDIRIRSTPRLKWVNLLTHRGDVLDRYRTCAMLHGGMGQVKPHVAHDLAHGGLDALHGNMTGM